VKIPRVSGFLKTFSWRPNLLDKGDDFVLESAIASGALIITKNIRDFRGGELQFPDLLILTPQQFCDFYLTEEKSS